MVNLPIPERSFTISIDVNLFLVRISFTFWVFEPFASFLEYVLEIRLFPIIALIGLVFLFSAKTVEKN